jgi:hypothetical protein
MGNSLEAYRSAIGMFYNCSMSYIGFISGKAEKKHRKIFHNYFCYSKKDEQEDLLSKEQLREKNEKKSFFVI